MVNKSTTQVLLASCLMCSTVMPNVSVADVGSVRSADNRILGSIDSDGTVRDANNRIRGKISGGTVRSADNRILGTVDDGGTVRDASNRIIASVSAADTDQIAVVVFFFPKSLLK